MVERRYKSADYIRVLKLAIDRFEANRREFSWNMTGVSPKEGYDKAYIQEDQNVHIAQELMRICKYGVLKDEEDR